MCRETVLSPKLLLFRVEDFPRGSSFRHFQGKIAADAAPLLPVLMFWCKLFTYY